MRNFCIALIAAAALVLASPVFAQGVGQGGPCPPNNPVCNSGGGGGGGGTAGTGAGGAGGAGGVGQGGIGGQGGNAFGQGGTGVGVGVGIGVGGDSNARARSNSNATGGNATGGNATAGVSLGSSTFGNSRVRSSNRQGQGQQQGQQQDSSQANAQNTNIDVSDRSSYSYKERKQPVASAAPVFATACSSGVSAQSFGFGGSLASTNPMCDLALAAEMARAGGDEELSQELMQRAAKYARARSNVMRRWSQYLPIIGNIY